MLAHRGREISRIEQFSDAAFAFGLTLLVVSLEVWWFGKLTEQRRRTVTARTGVVTA
jgi:hypothetical protein